MSVIIVAGKTYRLSDSVYFLTIFSFCFVQLIVLITSIYLVFIAFVCREQICCPENFFALLFN